MAVVTPPGVDTLPPTPSSSAPTTFAALADTFFAALANFRAQLVALGANIFSNATDAASSASTASAAQTAAALSAAAASNAAGAAAVNAAAPAWVSGTAYAQYAAALSPTDFRVYRRKTAGSGTTDPSLDASNWAPVLTPMAPLIHVRETQPSGTASTALTGASASNSYIPRVFNGSVGAITIAGAGLSGGNVVLPAGTYEFEGESVIYSQSSSNFNKVSLYNVTDAADIQVGMNGNDPLFSGNAFPSSVGMVKGRFTLTATKTVSLRHWLGNASNSPSSTPPNVTMGNPVSNGQVEVYASLIIKMIG